MILHQNMTFQAKLEQGQLVVFDRSPDLPMLSEHMLFMSYLHRLSYANMRVKHMAFDGFVLTAEIESCDPDSNHPPHYLIQMMAQTLSNSSMSQVGKDQKDLNEDFSESIRADGWVELATSKPLADLLGSLVIVSIWMKQ